MDILYENHPLVYLPRSFSLGKKKEIKKRETK